jgi:hypothetical protein
MSFCLLLKQLQIFGFKNCKKAFLGYFLEAKKWLNGIFKLLQIILKFSKNVCKFVETLLFFPG